MPGAPVASRRWHYARHSDPQSSHQQIAALIRAIGRAPILDVGAAQGTLGELLRADGVTIDAVEPNSSWAEHARPFYRTVYVAAIEEATLPTDTYRVVVCADVLEHTANPGQVLEHLCRSATSDAIFIVSVPNVAHLAARLMLVFGRFPKMDRGIFDRTHLHFYTRHTALELLRDAGLRETSVRATPVPLEEIWPAWLGQGLLRTAMAIQRIPLRLWPTLFGFQWIVVAQKELKS
jgi:2-polyprenyl-3-methyl-5-hydroxy-6-metoxy-1,4-benzoquinol methylase